MVLKKIFFGIITLMLLSNSGCNKDPDFDIKRLTYRGQFVYNNQLRIDGMYYMSEEDGGLSIIYLFKDGTCYFVFMASEQYDLSSICCYQLNSTQRKIASDWGFYLIDDNVLKAQTFDIKPMGSMYTVEERWATIEDDKTLHFFRSMRNRPTGPKDVKLNDTYHFKYCTDKPDSTNILMKYY